MQRYGMVIGAKADQIEVYKKLHVAVWPDVLAMIRKSNIHNFRIHLRKLPDGKHYLFSYLGYVGSDFQADVAKVAIVVSNLEPVGPLGDAPFLAVAGVELRPR